MQIYCDIHPGIHPFYRHHKVISLQPTKEIHTKIGILSNSEVGDLTPNISERPAYLVEGPKFLKRRNVSPKIGYNRPRITENDPSCSSATVFYIKYH